MFRNQSSGTDPELYPVLAERSIAYLQERGVPHDIAKAAGLSSLTKHQIEYLLAREGANTSDGLGIPYKGYGEISWRVRLDEVRDQDKKNRWRWSKGEPVRPYLPPVIPVEVWQDVSYPIVITEGPVKSLAVWAATGTASIGLAGVDTGHVPALWHDAKIAQLHAELLARVKWEGRRVVIAFDAGRATNPMVAFGEARLALALARAKALVYAAELPALSGVGEGPDDFIKARGGEAFQEILDKAPLADPVARIREAFLGPAREAARMVYGWLTELPFVAALHIGGGLAQASAATESKKHILKSLFSQKAAEFAAKLVGKTLAAKSGTENVEELIAKMNIKHAIVKQGANVSILWEQESANESSTTSGDASHRRKIIEFHDKASLDLFYANDFLYVRGDGKSGKQVSILQYWLKHPQRRTYPTVVFDPQGEPENAYNLWTGWTIPPVQGDWGLLKAHIWENICSKNKEIFRWVISWMADAIQNPGKKPGTAIILRGKEGVGKGVLVSAFGSLFGQHFMQVSNPEHATGKFNSHLANCLLLFGDEAFWGGDKKTDGIIKDLVTGEMHNIEPKGKAIFRMPNLLRVILASNNEWVISAGMEARRYLVLDVSEARMQDKPYFAAIQEQLANGGREAMMYDLMHLDISGVDLRTVPQTKALLEQKLLSMDAIKHFWLNRLEEGEPLPGKKWDEWIPCEALYALYVKEAAAQGEKRRLASNAFGRHMKKLCPGLERDKPEISHTARSEYTHMEITRESRVWAYRFPPLDKCRAAFEAQLQSSLDWDVETDNSIPRPATASGASQPLLPLRSTEESPF